MKLLPLAALRLTLILTGSLATFASAQAPAIRPAADYGKLPLSFEANQGQTDPSVQFLAHGQGYTLFLRQGEAVLALERSAAASATQSSVVRMALVGANPAASVSSQDQQITRTNYFLGNDPAKWHTGIPNYSRVRYQAIYNGIDLVYYGRQRQLEHDFIIAPNADPSQIVLAFNSRNNLLLDPATGDLILSSDPSVSRAALALRLLKPVTYQTVHDRRIPVPSAYKLLPNHRISFTLGRYDHSQPLVIDPVLVYSTYLGGSGSGVNGDKGNGIAVDAAGDAYVVGTAYSANFPTTTGVFEATDHAPAGVSTVFVTKLNSTGTALLFSTFLGGSGGDSGYAIGLDSSGNPYIAGATYSTDFPTTCGAYQAANPSTTPGAPTAFVASLLGSSGAALLYSTYLGGSGNQTTPAPGGDVAQAIAVDPGGNAYITGYTFSADFPTTASAFQPTFAGLAGISNAFVTKLNFAGTSLLYSTYLGGNGANGTGDYGNAIAIDASGDAYIAGSTGSVNFPVTPSAYQAQNRNSAGQGAPTGFVSKLNPAGSAEIYSTYLGGSTGESIHALTVDRLNYVYVGGVTQSSDYPVTDGVVEGFSSGIANYLGPSGATAAFVTKLNLDGSALKYSTFLEGQSTTVAGLAVDPEANLYATGSATAVLAGAYYGFQASPGALPTPASTGVSAYVVKLNAAATVFSYASLLGGSSNDAANAIALDSARNLYLTGIASSTNFPTTTGVVQTALAATAPATNAFVARLALDSENNATHYPSLPEPMNPTTMTASGSLSYQCYGPGSEGSDSFSLDVSAALSGSGGPPPIGVVTFFDNAGQDCSYYGFCLQQVQEPASNGKSFSYDFSFSDGDPYDAPSNPITVNWTVSYSGDQYYAPSSASGSNLYPGCPAPSYSSPGFSSPGFSSARSSDSARKPASTLLPLIPRSTARNAPGKASGPASLSGPMPPDQRMQPARFLLPRPGASATLRSNAIRNAAPASSCIASGFKSPLVTPGSFVFPATNLNSTSLDTVTLINTSASSISLAPYIVTGGGANEFKVAGKTCGATLASGASCAIELAFTPTTTTMPIAALSVTETAPTSYPQSIPIVATPTNYATLSFSPVPLVFPATQLGRSSYPIPLTITNTSTTAAAALTSFTFDGANASEFSLVSQTCGASLAAGAHCTVSIAFTPTSPSAPSAVLVINDGALNSPQKVTLSASVSAGLPILRFTPASLNFPVIPPTPQGGPTSVSAPLTLTVSNFSPTVPVSIGSFQTAGPEGFAFSIVGKTCTTTLAPGASCTLSIVFAAPIGYGSGPFPNSLVVTDDATGSPQSVPIIGNVGDTPTLSFSPNSLAFPTAGTGTSTNQSVTITNTSATTPTDVSSYTISGASQFVLVGKTCGTVLAPRASCTLAIAFRPTVAGPVSASLVVSDNANSSPQNVSLTGTGK